jgi:hypothetical protein
MIQEVLTKDLNWYSDKTREWKKLVGNIENGTSLPQKELIIPTLTVYGCNALGIAIVFTKDKYFFLFCQGSEKRTNLFKRFISGEAILVAIFDSFIIF